MKDAAKILLTVFGVLIVIAAIVSAVWAIRYFTAETRGIITAEEQIESAPSRITRYEHFFDLCAAAQSMQHALKAQEERLQHASSDKEASRIRSNVAGIKSNLARTINQYNSEASQDYTSGRFKASNLPWQLSHEGEIKCAQ